MAALQWQVNRADLETIEQPGLGIRLSSLKGDLWVPDDRAVVVRLSDEIDSANATISDAIYSYEKDGVIRRYTGFLNMCTHMGCRLARFKPSNENEDQPIVARISDTENVCGPCPCHGTTFDLLQDGLVVLGAATENLPILKLAGATDPIIFTLPHGKDPEFDEDWPN